MALFKTKKKRSTVTAGEKKPLVSVLYGASNTLMLYARDLTAGKEIDMSAYKALIDELASYV